MGKGKNILTSKTLWINIIAIVILVLQNYTSYAVGPEF